jgi:hypothetical protein
VNIEEVKKHPDIQHLKEAISGLFGVTSVKSGGKNVEESVF